LLISFITGARNTRELQVLDQRDENLAAASSGMETTRIEQTRGKNLGVREKLVRSADA
jgi:hypothetical protein